MASGPLRGGIGGSCGLVSETARDAADDGPAWSRAATEAVAHAAASNAAQERTAERDRRSGMRASEQVPRHRRTSAEDRTRVAAAQWRREWRGCLSAVHLWPRG